MMKKHQRKFSKENQTQSKILPDYIVVTLSCADKFKQVVMYTQMYIVTWLCALSNREFT